MEAYNSIFGNSVSIRNWFAQQALDRKNPDIDCPLVLIGNGPYELNEFRAFLESYGITNILLEKDDWVFERHGQCPLFIVGQSDFLTPAFLSLFMEECILQSPTVPVSDLLPGAKWIQRHINADRQVIFYRSKRVRNPVILSQEMLLAGLFVQLRKMGYGWQMYFGEEWASHYACHPALKELRSLRRCAAGRKKFPWPTTDLKGGAKVGSTYDCDDGLLAYLGYRVGKSGKPRSERREILSSLYYAASIPKEFETEAGNSWGTGESAYRLHRMAELIATLAKFSKGRDDTSVYAQAIADWEEDLAWLKETFYDGRFDDAFFWPQPL